MSLPQLQPGGQKIDSIFTQMQTLWGAILNPIVANPILRGQPIYNISLLDGVPKVIPTGLNRMQLGWFLIDQDNDANIWRYAPLNATNLTLVTDQDVAISIWVF